jgi:hypothetical protein
MFVRVSALPANPNALELILFYVPVANIEVSMFVRNQAVSVYSEFDGA